MSKNWFKKFSISVEKIKLIIYDFDGVMTNNNVILDENGKESVIVNRADGLAISHFKKIGIKQIIVSTEKNTVVEKRANKINVDCFSGINNKKKVVKNYLEEHDIHSENVIYVGNDINDLEAMNLVGIKIAPSDAVAEIKKIATYVTKRKGGEGVVRELLDLIIKQ